ncbi:MAG: MFS transporter [Candidatus Dormibacteraeota bacterium]|uniref:MFS transporter n=1 Tax=Candidatus Dormiibacter inghamiae TaxID=3127013 RepID=A0A934K947_9BACT|nr:MFS transporter [Candidatus Dormibacteraeota bacterium]
MVNADSKATRSLRGWTLALTSLAFFMVALDALVVITALPAIHRDLGAGLATLQWTVNAYSLAFGAGIITAASVGDRFGRRRIFATGLALFSTTSAACAVAPTAELLIVARAIQGLGGALIMPLSLTILTATFPLARRGAIVGLWGGIGGLAIASGPRGGYRGPRLALDLLGQRADRAGSDNPGRPPAYR